MRRSPSPESAGSIHDSAVLEAQLDSESAADAILKKKNNAPQGLIEGMGSASTPVRPTEDCTMPC